MQVSQIKPTGDLWPQPSWAKCLLLHQLFMAWPVSETEEVWHLDHLWCLVVRQPLSMGIRRTKCAPVGLNFIVQVMLHGLCWKSIAPELDWESVFPNLLYKGLVKRLFAQLLFRPIENVIQINDLSSTEINHTALSFCSSIIWDQLQELLLSPVQMRYECVGKSHENGTGWRQQEGWMVNSWMLYGEGGWVKKLLAKWQHVNWSQVPMTQMKRVSGHSGHCWTTFKSKWGSTLRFIVTTHKHCASGKTIGYLSNTSTSCIPRGYHWSLDSWTALKVRYWLHH